jgi:hypothetical protein
MTSFSVAIGLVVVIGWMNGSQSVSAQSGTGGFLVSATDNGLRARLSAAQIQTFLPARGRFTFPSPYNTQAARITNGSDCGGQDCVHPVGYSYWSNMNNHVGSSRILIFLGLERRTGGGGPTLFSYDKNTGEVKNEGALFGADSPLSWSTGEGWYFSATQPNTLYVNLTTSPQLQRFDVITHALTTVFDVSSRPDLFGTNRYIWQLHSSNDDRVHSATLQDGSFTRLGCVVYRSQNNRFLFFPPPSGYGLDECHVDKSGNWLILLETDPTGAETNRIVDLRKGTVTTIDDVDGALGHLDMGFGYAVGADNWNPDPNATILLKFPPSTTARPIGPVVHFNKRWDIAAANHIAHGNAVAGLAPEFQYACGSNASRVPDMADEIVCFSLDAARHADGSLDVLVVAPVMTDLDALGGHDVDGDDYEKRPKGNLDVTGRYFLWTTNVGGDRLDAFLVKVPAELLTTPQPNSPMIR